MVARVPDTKEFGCLVSDFSYRPEIDGLRAVAVLAVLFFHARLGCPGGFVGVDVFFVISGFLITSLIWRDLEQGQFSFAHFWERRARRILPALFVGTFAVLLAGAWLMLPDDYRSLGQAAASQSVFAANVHYWRESGYFATAAEVKPLLHTWSLAVEEQFYLFMPFLLFGLFHVKRLRTRTNLILVLSLLFLGSLAISIYGVSRYRTASFFLLPTRAWELLAGSLIVFLPKSDWLKNSRRFCEALAWSSLLCLLVPVFVYNDATPFPGLAALPCCMGTGLLIYIHGHGSTGLGKLLSTRPLVFVGLISYSLYLWHWPLLAFGNYLALESLSVIARCVMLAVGFALAVISWRYVETPFRKRALGSTRPQMFGYAGAMLVCLLVSGWVVLAQQGMPGRYTESNLALGSGKQDRNVYPNLSLHDIRQSQLERIGDVQPDKSIAIMVWGDSFAMAALPAIDEFLDERGMAGVAAMHTSTPPMIGFSHAEGKGVQHQKEAYDAELLRYVQAKQIPDVVLVACWRVYAKQTGFEAALLDTVEALVKVGARPWVLCEPPKHDFDVPRAISQPLISSNRVQELLVGSKTRSEETGIGEDLESRIVGLGGKVINPMGYFLDPTESFYRIRIENESLYYDNAHLSIAGARLVLLPCLKERLILAETESSKRDEG